VIIIISVLFYLISFGQTFKNKIKTGGKSNNNRDNNDNKYINKAEKNEVDYYYFTLLMEVHSLGIAARDSNQPSVL
jgi:hypothetical protein